VTGHRSDADPQVASHDPPPGHAERAKQPQSSPRAIFRVVAAQWRVVAALALSIGITVLVVVFRDRIKGIETLGYPGVFLLSFLANATVIFPAPGLAFTFAAGSVLNPVLVGLVAGAGETLGEVTGYLAGYAGRTVVSRDSRYTRLENFTRRYGGLSVFLLALIPAAVFDIVGVVAGAMRMPITRFLLYTWVGKTGKTIVFAYAGAHSVTWILRLINHSG